ncbi:bifunctional adenosylcobinamide kinase/adenosylcobinamide-phosphate guanylyltransferase [Hydrogenophaga sp.]|uniref:bifunctional adenosylcobinamide kinase/adenosylcobinamide-phosphate guanylyltransferase n=1 Tax=Hydrogenophaga sp. TaxID=1904254 RepID=UPI0025C1429C|nr:bifunctional adenosylcobinamide kinase/adenosylcobinamide-phosphate guanylyltransferase [Hydrogenophaga sp.]
MGSPRTELILGGQKSGKSARAEQLANDWMRPGGERSSVLIATGLPADAEMAARIVRHQQDRATRTPALQTEEEPRHLAEAIRRHSAPQSLLVVDCLTLWLTNLLMPAQGNALTADELRSWVDALGDAIGQAPGPVVLVSNEIGLGVIPMGREVRAFVDTLGLLNQRIATGCDRVTLMVAGCAITVKDSA